MSTTHKTSEQIQQELKIIEAAKKDPRRFSPLYDAYYKPIFLYVYKRVDSEEATADITSQVFLKAITNIQKYKFQGVPFSAWLFRIATNEINQFFRKTKKQRAVSIDIPGVEMLMKEMDEPVDNTAHIKVLISCLNLLKEVEVQLLEMRFFEQMSFKEISDILGITENNAKVKAYRVVEKLRKIINEQGNFDNE